MYTKDGKISSCKAIELNGRWVSNPSEEQILEAGWTPYVPPMEVKYEPSYEERVVSLIREKYDENQEYEILREAIAYPDNKDVKNRFDIYNSYVESCKLKAQK